MTQKLILSLLASIFYFQLTAQTLNDALRYSSIQVSGTARLMTTGGALGALGGDFGVLSINPAGVASYRRSSLEITPSLNFINTESTFANNSNSQTEPNFNLNNVGLVFAKINNDREADWKTSNFAIGMNRTHIFTQNVYFQGTNTGTIQERWLQFANGLPPNQLYNYEEGIAFDANILYNPGSDSTVYESDLTANDRVQKEQNINRSGSISDVVVAFGGNYRHKLYIGVALGIPVINFTETKSYTETDVESVSPFFNEMTYNENLNTEGVGINLKLGIIYRASQSLRIGAAVHSPTYMALSDQFATDISSNLTINGSTDVLTASAPIGNFSYQLTTPWRAIGSVAYIFGRKGFVTGEIEYVDYTASNFNINDDPNFEQDLNNQIDNQLTSAINFRLGGEMIFGKIAVRGGYGVNATPYATPLSPDEEIVQTLSIGAGLRTKRFLFDLGYLRSSFLREYEPYTANSPNIVRVQNNVTRNRLVATLGFRF